MGDRDLESGAGGVDKAAKLRALAGVREKDMMLESAHEDHGSPVFDRLNELTRKLNQSMRELQLIRQEIERRVQAEASGKKKMNDNYGATGSSKDLTGLTLEGLLQKGKGICEQIKEVMHDLEQNQKRAKTPGEKQSCASSLKVAGETFKESLKDFIDLEGRYRDLVEAKMKENKTKGIALPPPDKGYYYEGGNQQQVQNQQKRKSNVAVPIGDQRDAQYQKLQDLANQNAAMLQFEQQVLMLNEMMEYCDALCEEQAKILESIEGHVDATDEYVGEAVVRLEAAEQHQASYLAKRRMLFWMAFGCCVIGIITLILLSIFCFAPACAGGKASCGGGR